MATDRTREQAARLLAVMAERMKTYRQLLADLAEGTLAPDAFRREAVATGLIVDDDGAWIFDVANTRWMHYDGVELRAVADADGPAPRRARSKRS